MLDTIAAQAAGASIDEGFWRSIYSYEGGGGRNTISGWSTAFLAYLVDQATGDRVSYRPKRLDESGWQRDHRGIDHFAIPSHVSSVRFTWRHTLREYPMTFAGGVLGADVEDEHTLVPRLSYAVLHRPA